MLYFQIYFPIDWKLIVAGVENAIDFYNWLWYLTHLLNILISFAILFLHQFLHHIFFSFPGFGIKVIIKFIKCAGQLLPFIFSGTAIINTGCGGLVIVERGVVPTCKVATWGRSWWWWKALGLDCDVGYAICTSLKGHRATHTHCTNGDFFYIVLG